MDREPCWRVEGYPELHFCGGHELADLSMRSLVFTKFSPSLLSKSIAQAFRRAFRDKQSDQQVPREKPRGQRSSPKGLWAVGYPTSPPLCDGSHGPPVPVSSSPIFCTLHKVLWSFTGLSLVAGALVDVYSMMRGLKKQPWAPLSNLSKWCHVKTPLKVSIVRKTLERVLPQDGLIWHGGGLGREKTLKSNMEKSGITSPSSSVSFPCSGSGGRTQSLRQRSSGTTVELNH